MSCALGGPVIARLTAAQGASTATQFFFLAGDLPGGIRLSLSLAGGKAGSLPQEGTEISYVLNVLKTQD